MAQSSSPPPFLRCSSIPASSSSDRRTDRAGGPSAGGRFRIIPSNPVPANPADAAPGTIRKEFALSIGENSVHGSDGPDTAAEEIAYFFAGMDIVG